jgi:hypothetical protein
MWNNDYNYQQTLIGANRYYETSPYKAKKKSTKFKARKVQISESWIFNT